jgi:hypothetical protein
MQCYIWCLLALLTDVPGVRIRWLEQVDRGADNPTSYIPNYHETRKGGQGPIQGCSATKEEEEVHFERLQTKS